MQSSSLWERKNEKKGKPNPRFHVIIEFSRRRHSNKFILYPKYAQGTDIIPNKDCMRKRLIHGEWKQALPSWNKQFTSLRIRNVQIHDLLVICNLLLRHFPPLQFVPDRRIELSKRHSKERHPHFTLPPAHNGPHDGQQFLRLACQPLQSTCVCSVFTCSATRLYKKDTRFSLLKRISANAFSNTTWSYGSCDLVVSTLTGKNATSFWNRVANSCIMTFVDWCIWG